MGDLYVIALFDSEGVFESYERKGRGGQIVGYDNLSSAKRGLAHTKRNNFRIIHQGYTAEIAKAGELTFAGEVD